LILLSFAITLAQLPALTVEERPRYAVSAFVPIELQQDAPPVALIMDIGITTSLPGKFPLREASPGHLGEVKDSPTNSGVQLLPVSVVGTSYKPSSGQISSEKRRYRSVIMHNSPVAGRGGTRGLLATSVS
jgi:hypothetical protein